MPSFSDKQETIARIQEGYHYYDYTYERFSNGNCEILVYPIAGVINRFNVIQCEGAPMRYQFDHLGRAI